MLKAFVDRILEIGKPNIEVIGDRFYSDKTLNLITEPKPVTLGLSTLTSLVDYITANKDKLKTDELSIHVDSPTRVLLFGNLRENNQRFVYAYAELPSDCQFNKFGEYLDQESMVIALQTFFAQGIGDLGGLQKIVGGLQSSKTLLLKDDGITQVAEIKAGISTSNVERKDIVNPMTLTPYRTFREVAQPSSSFVVRLKNSSQEPKIAIFEAEGGAWKMEAMKSIKEYLKDNLTGDVTILA